MEQMLRALFEFVNHIPLKLAIWDIFNIGFSCIVPVVLYVLQAMGLYTIAKRRRIRHAWLSWLPVGNVWILGSISDQYQYVVKGNVKNKRKLLLVLGFLQWAVNLMTAFFGVLLLVRGLGLRFDSYVTNGEVLSLLGILMCLLWSAFLSLGLQVALSVVSYMAVFNLYTSCNPINDVIFLLWSIFIYGAQPILVFICRKKDRGMPRRKTASAEQISEELTEENQPQ